MAVFGVGSGRRLRRAFALGWLLVAVGLSGCEGGEPGTSAGILCSTMCERAAQCGGRANVRACKQDCEADPGNLNDFRTDFMEELATCLRGLSCAVFFDAPSFDMCWASAREGLEPNHDTREFCSENTQVWFDCGSAYFRDQCERDWVVFAGESLGRVAKCHEGVACNELNACADAALGVAQ